MIYALAERGERIDMRPEGPVSSDTGSNNCVLASRRKDLSHLLKVRAHELAWLMLAGIGAQHARTVSVIDSMTVSAPKSE